MKHLRRVKVLSFLLVPIICCNSCEPHSQNSVKNNGGQESKSRQNSKRNFHLISDTDVVCGYPVYDYCCDTVVYRNRIYGFCCHGCKHEFNLHPIKYASNYQ
ncbi:MAG: YHS domain-containing protein [Bacteroidetes bacterium]|nr:YHS domain-containing protein [Bacteroidota bacterium]MBP6401365.1 YHS domain-containing protein [Bacteroidia bacterium]MBK6836963.1 YHS domain-containing protein [Bacteroidota bacterium]MBK9523634.1 YHS domain-containing protein [Bacteroidota bacterium]MBK9541380.1 YHS domain-containing protein [Bacteroidota bacterium]